MFLAQEGRGQLWKLLFDFDGRISRTSYWIAWLAQIIVSILLVPIFMLLGWIPLLPIVLMLIVWLLMLNASIAVGRKRLHDRGKSGWWLLVFLGVPIVLEVLQRWVIRDVAGLELVTLAIFVWMIVELGCLQGTVGPNAYGPDPLADSSVPA